MEFYENVVGEHHLGEQGFWRPGLLENVVSWEGVLENGGFEGVG